MPSGSCTGTWARSSQPSGPSTSSMTPPCWVMPEAISSRTSPQMPSFLGAAKACSWTALSRSTTVAATIASPATSTRSSMPSTPGTKRPPRSTRPSPGSRTSETSQGPSGRGSGSSLTRSRLARSSSASASTPSTTCSASPAASSAAPFFLRRPNTSLSFPVGYDRSVSIPTRWPHGGLALVRRRPRRHDRRWTRSPPRPAPSREAPPPPGSGPSRPAGRPVGQSGRSARTAPTRAGRDSPRSP